MATKRNKNIKREETRKKLSKAPFIVQVCFMSLLIVGAIIVIVFIFREFKPKIQKQVYVQLLLGLAATILSLVLAINALSSSISNKNSRKKENIRLTTTALTTFIDVFNNRYLATLNRQISLLDCLESKKGITFAFDVSLNNQKENVEKVDNFLTKNNLDFMEEYLYYCSVFSFSGDIQFDQNVVNLRNIIISDRKNGKSISGYVSSIGGSEIIRYFRKERIDILNFFENLGISYFNENVNRVMVEAQFKHMLQRIIPLFYYLIYKDEGLDCYPYLNMMLKYIFEK